jgi:DNA-directed RNA polymerase specialized sigma24 family protein
VSGTRSNRFPLKKIIERLDRKRGSGAVVDLEVKRRIAAIVLAYSRGWSAERVARYFGWPTEEVERWIETGKFRPASSVEKNEEDL